MQQRAEVLVDASEDADKSSAFDMAEQVLNLVLFPAAMTSTTFGFEVLNAQFYIGDDFPAVDDARWSTVYDTAGAALSYSIPAGSSPRAVSLDWSSVFGSRWIRLTFGSNEAADRQVFLFTQQIG